MNRDQVKGKTKDVAGKVQQKGGQLTGSKTQQAKGVAKQVEGKMQKGMGNFEQALDKADNKTRCRLICARSMRLEPSVELGLSQ